MIYAMMGEEKRKGALIGSSGLAIRFSKGKVSNKSAITLDGGETLRLVENGILVVILGMWIGKARPACQKDVKGFKK